MRIESWIFGAGVFFFVPISIIYGFLTNWSEWVGILGILLVVALIVVGGSVALGGDGEATPVASVSDAAPTQTAPDAGADAVDSDGYSADEIHGADINAQLERRRGHDAR